VRDADGLWFATPGAIHAHVAELALAEAAA
jgi:hypothetical protein